jgi:putative membrane protein
MSPGTRVRTPAHPRLSAQAAPALSLSRNLPIIRPGFGMGNAGLGRRVAQITNHAEPPAVRFLFGTILLVFLGAVALFAVQNTQEITVRFGNWGVTAPVALLAIAAYLVGMLSGWTVVGFVRSSIRRVTAETRRE